MLSAESLQSCSVKMSHVEIEEERGKPINVFANALIFVTSIKLSPTWCQFLRSKIRSDHEWTER